MAPAPAHEQREIQFRENIRQRLTELHQLQTSEKVGEFMLMAGVEGPLNLVENIARAAAESEDSAIPQVREGARWLADRAQQARGQLEEVMAGGAIDTRSVHPILSALAEETVPFLVAERATAGIARIPGIGGAIEAARGAPLAERVGARAGRGVVLGETFEVAREPSLEHPERFLHTPAAFALLETGMTLAGAGIGRAVRPVREALAVRRTARALLEEAGQEVTPEALAEMQQTILPLMRLGSRVRAEARPEIPEAAPRPAPEPEVPPEVAAPEEAVSRAAKFTDEEVQRRRLRESVNIELAHAEESGLLMQAPAGRPRYVSEAGGTGIEGAVGTGAGWQARGRQTQARARLAEVEAEAQTRGLSAIEEEEVYIEAADRLLKREEFDLRVASADELGAKRQELEARLAADQADTDAGLMWAGVETQLGRTTGEQLDLGMVTAADPEIDFVLGRLQEEIGPFTRAEAQAIIHGKADEIENILKSKLRTAGIDPDAVDIPQARQRTFGPVGAGYGDQLEGPFYGITERGEALEHPIGASHQGAVNLALEEAWRTVTSIRDTELPYFRAGGFPRSQAETLRPRPPTEQRVPEVPDVTDEAAVEFAVQPQGQFSLLDPVRGEAGAMRAVPDPLGEHVDLASLPEHSRRIQESIGTGRVPRAPVWQRVTDAYTAIVRSTHGVERAERQLTGGQAIPSHRSAFAAARMTQGSARRSEGFLEVGTMRWTPEGNIEITGPGYAEIQARVPGRAAELSRYELAERTLEVWEGPATAAEATQAELGIPPVPKPRRIVTPISPEDARLEVAGVDAAVRDAHEAKVQWRRGLLQYAADSGGFSPASLEAMDALGRHYVSLRRAFEGRGAIEAGVQPGRAPRFVHRLRGSPRHKILNPIEADLDRAFRMVRASDFHRVSLRLVELAELYPDAAKGMIERVERRASARALNEDALRLRGATEQVGLELPDEVLAELAEQLSDRGLSSVDPTISLWRNGQLERWRVDPKVRAALNSLAPHEIDWFWRLMGLPAKTFKGGITLAPGFAFFNFIRDTFDATIQSQYGFRLGVDSFKGFLESVNANWFNQASRQYEEFVLGGGGFSTLRGAGGGTARQFARRHARRITPTTFAERRMMNILHPVEALKTFAQPFEEAGRIGEFMRARGKGANVIDAFMAQQDVTVNFLEHGGSATMNGLAHSVPFLNPAVQSLDRSIRVMGRGVGEGRKALAAGEGVGAAAVAGAKPTLRVLLTAFGAVSLPSIYFWAASRDDQEIQDYRKTNAGLIYWFYRGPDGAIHRKPKPFLWGQIFGTGIESALDAAYDNDPEAGERFRRGVLEQAGSNVLPIVLDMWVEQKRNRDSFFKTPIVPIGAEGLEARFQTQSYTGTVAREIGDIFNVSPARIEHLWGDVTGTLGRHGLRMVDLAVNELRQRNDPNFAGPPAPEAADIPALGRFWVRETSLNKEPVRTFYDRLGELEKLNRTYLHLYDEDPVRAYEYSDEHIDDLALLPFYRAASREIKLIRDEKEALRRISDAQLSPERKRQITVDLNNLIVEQARETNLITQGVGEASLPTGG